MSICEHCQNLLLDFVYGLLEESELQELREHLTSCPSCQAALEKAQQQQTLMARAALAIAPITELAVPSDKPVANPSQAATLPLVNVPRPKRPIWQSPRLAWSAAAAVLLAIGVSASLYRHELHTRQEALTVARRDQATVELQFAGMPAQFEAAHRDAVADLHRKTGPYIHVVGPTTLLPHAKAPVHITTRTVEGDLAASTIRLRMVDTKTGTVVHSSRVVSNDGHARAEIDSADARPESTLSLIVEAETATGTSRLQESVSVQPPSFVSCLNTSKTAYQLKDVLFFRVLVLDRCALTPPGQAIALRAELKDPAGKTVAYADGQTGEGGVFAGELPIVENFAAGTHTLHVAPTRLDQANVQPAWQTIDVIREMPALRVDQNRYLPGSTLTGNLALRAGQSMPKQAKGTINGQAVDVTLQPQAASGAPGGFGAGFRNVADKDSANKAAEAKQFFRFSAPIPANLAGANAELKVEVPDGKKMQNYNALVRLEPTEFTIDFFPEGGDLIAGVKNRVFYRVRTKNGEAVAGDGRVILLTGKNDIVDTHYKLGLGYLDFTPNLKETYTVRITTPTKVAELAQPFKIRREGVVLHVPRAVGHEGDPIRIVLRQQGPPRKLILLAHCRGQIVDERTVEVKTDPVNLTLQPTPDARGMIRVTAYEVIGDQLQPVAERLVYRASSQRLDLGFAVKARQPESGQNIDARIHAVDETGKPAAAWLLASVVDERFQPRPRSLSAHFLLFNEIHTGADLDNAALLLNDTPESAQMLERFLGTHGWRRFVPAAARRCRRSARAGAGADFQPREHAARSVAAEIRDGANRDARTAVQGRVRPGNRAGQRACTGNGSGRPFPDRDL